MKPGKNYLIHAGDWHTFVGRFVEQVSPLLYRFEQVSKISDTNNMDNWQDLCSDKGNARSEASYKHYDVAATLPISIIAFDWIGDLPKRD